MSRQSRCGATRARWATTRCSRTVNPMNSSGCWKVRASPRAARARTDAVGDVLAPQPHRSRHWAAAVRTARPAGSTFRLRWARPARRCSPVLDLEGHVGECGEPPEPDGDVIAHRAPVRSAGLWTLGSGGIGHRAPSRDPLGDHGPASTDLVSASVGAMVSIGELPAHRIGRASRAAAAWRNRRLCSARTPSGYLAAEIAPRPKSTGNTLAVHAGRYACESAGSMTNASPATSAAACRPNTDRDEHGQPHDPGKSGELAGLERRLRQRRATLPRCRR